MADEIEYLSMTEILELRDELNLLPHLDHDLVQIDKQKADNDTRDSLTLAIERLQKVADSGGDLATALDELGIVEVFKQQAAQLTGPVNGAMNETSIQGRESLPAMEGGPPMALGLPQGGGGPIISG